MSSGKIRSPYWIGWSRTASQFRYTYMLFMPKLSNSLLTTASALAPMEVMAMTELMPMMMPSMVRKDRILFILMDESASLMFSISSIRTPPGESRL